MGRMATRSGLRRRIFIGLFSYTVLLTIAVLMHGYVFNERAEELVWRSLLESELDHFVERTAQDPEYRWTDTDKLKLYKDDAISHVPPELRAHLPPELRTLPPGVHDDVPIDGGKRIVLVRRIGEQRLLLTLDITDLEQGELDLTKTLLGSAAVAVVLLSLATAWAAGHLVRPLSDLAKRIAGLRPDRAGGRIEFSRTASAELVVIADALNDYLERNERFVERERAFIDSASHELRTPIAVIAGATELALDQPDVPAAARNQLARIQRTAREVERLISFLLVLAKDPTRLMNISDRVALDQLIPDIVDDHRYLTRDKDLMLTVEPLVHSEIVAPIPIVQAAIGNLLRNAIENSDRGEIKVRMDSQATVVIEDPGHGMTPEEIGAVYARVARGGGDRHGGGIGLHLISRLSEHLGWKLEITSRSGCGTITTLKFGQR